MKALPHSSPVQASRDNAPPLPVLEVTSREVFILRLWRSAAGEAWRGQVQHVASGQVIALSSLQDLLAALQAQLDHSPPVENRLR